MYKMNNIQKRALRVMLNNYQSSYKDLLKEVNRLTLYVNRMKNIFIEMFRCVQNIGPSVLRNMFRFQEQPCGLRVGCKFIQPMVCAINSCRYERTKVWNNLPEYSKDDNEEFKQLIVNGQVQNASAKTAFYIMWTTYNDMPIITTLHLISTL